MIGAKSSGKTGAKTQTTPLLRARLRSLSSTKSRSRSGQAGRRCYSGMRMQEPSASALCGRTYDVSVDDRRFLMIKEQDTTSSTGPDLVLVEHWARNWRSSRN